MSPNPILNPHAAARERARQQQAEDDTRQADAHPPPEDGHPPDGDADDTVPPQGER